MMTRTRSVGTSLMTNCWALNECDRVNGLVFDEARFIESTSDTRSEPGHRSHTTPRQSELPLPTARKSSTAHCW
jgi:hypothetical protein